MSPAMPRFAPSGKAPSQEVLAEIVSRIREVIEPRRIILFGSAGRGEMNPGSDIDLMVVVDPENDRKRLSSRIHCSLHASRKDSLGFDFDVLVAHPLARECIRPFPIDVRERALLEGKVIHGPHSTKDEPFLSPKDRTKRFRKRSGKFIALARKDLKQAKKGVKLKVLHHESGFRFLYESIEKALEAVTLMLGKFPTPKDSHANKRKQLRRLGENPPIPDPEEDKMPFVKGWGYAESDPPKAENMPHLFEKAVQHAEETLAWAERRTSEIGKDERLPDMNFESPMISNDRKERTHPAKAKGKDIQH